MTEKSKVIKTIMEMNVEGRRGKEKSKVKVVGCNWDEDSWCVRRWFEKSRQVKVFGHRSPNLRYLEKGEGEKLEKHRHLVTVIRIFSRVRLRNISKLMETYLICFQFQFIYLSVQNNSLYYKI